LNTTKRVKDKRRASRRADKTAFDSPVKGAAPPRATGDCK